MAWLGGLVRKNMKLAVIGSRSFNDYDLLKTNLDVIKDKITEIVSGGAKGADSLARKYAQENSIALKEFIPDWEKFGKSAGFRRNKDIVGYCDSLVAFHDGISKGTQHSLNIAEELGKKYFVVLF